MLKNLVSEGGFIFGGRVLGVGLTFIYTAIITNSLGASNAGLFFLGQTIILILSLISRLGFDNLMVKKVSSFSIKDNSDEIWSLIYKVISLVLIMSIILVVLTNIISPSLESYFSIFRLQYTVDALSISIPLIAVLFIISESLKGLFFTILATFTQSILMPLSFSVFLFFFIGDLTIEKVLWGYILAAAISLLIVTCLLLYKLGYPGFHVFGAYPENNSSLLGESLPLLWAGAAGLVFSWTDTLVLGIVRDSADVGLYVVASRATQVIALNLMVANTLLGPRFARLSSAGQEDNLKKLFVKTAVIMFIIGIVSILPFIFLPKQILMLFGTEFIGAEDFILVLTVGQFINVASGAGGILLVMTGRGKELKNIMIFIVIFNLILSYLLGLSNGGLGVSIATSISMILMNLLILIFVFKYFNSVGYEI